ncbi:elongation factor P maturation arginine rhamnosyltransferase EarP [Dechloromonas sp. HYN0024]|nr:elongation factor P maturation arginine rhamnosyltransferase EarP [Dechloromonas sp. HYN0024]
MQLHWDIFCRVIDNFGDIGVCWRLARQLAAEHGRVVRLWVDEPDSLQPLCPSIDPTQAIQSYQGVEIHHWVDDIEIHRTADVVIEAFACELPDSYLAAMSHAEKKPCWINLEYLSAESWAEDCHTMASPHPTLPLVKYFFFPGFSAKTGGLLRENGLFAERDHHIAATPASALVEVCLFCYDTAPVGALLDAFGSTPLPVICHVAPGQPLAAVKAHLGGDGPWQLGKVLVQPMPFLPVDDFDRLLWRCDINFVRGEDSFVRAQWAGKPFVWQVYRQDDGAHLIKLEAFLQSYGEGLDELTKRTLRRLFVAWNIGGDIAAAWLEFLANRPAIADHNRHWADKLASRPDLAKALVNFCATKV